MGVRLYNPTTGRFLTTDPIPGGNENAYNYPNDPINLFDLDGKWFHAALSWAGRHKVDIALTAVSFIPGIGEAALALDAYRAYRGYRVVRAAQAASKLSRIRSYVRDGQNVLRVGRSQGVGEFRVSAGPIRRHWLKTSGIRRQVGRFHAHLSGRYGGLDWHTTARTYTRKLWG
jgi:hypothetical protein